MLLSVRFLLGREHIAAFSTISDTNQPLLLRLTAEVKNWANVETKPSWTELKQVCGQVCFASQAVFQIHGFAIQGSLSGTRSLCLVGLLAHLYLKLLCNNSVLISQHYSWTVVRLLYFLFEVRGAAKQVPFHLAGILFYSNFILSLFLSIIF